MDRTQRVATTLREQTDHLVAVTHGHIPRSVLQAIADAIDELERLRPTPSRNRNGATDG